MYRSNSQLQSRENVSNILQNDSSRVSLRPTPTIDASRWQKRTVIKISFGVYLQCHALTVTTVSAATISPVHSGTIGRCGSVRFQADNNRTTRSGSEFHSASRCLKPKARTKASAFIFLLRRVSLVWIRVDTRAPGKLFYEGSVRSQISAALAAIVSIVFASAQLITGLHWFSPSLFFFFFLILWVAAYTGCISTSRTHQLAKINVVFNNANLFYCNHL